MRRGSMRGVGVNSWFERFRLMLAPSLSINWSGKNPDSLLWLASFPRSGNTFTRILLANYFVESGTAYDINKLVDFISADTSPAVWNQIFGETAPTTLEETWRARPEFIRRYRATLTASTFPAIKTHTANVAIGGQEGFEFREGDRVLYIVRHPLDVLLSYAQFNGWDIDTTLRIMLTRGSYLFNERRNAFEVRGSWPEHVASWIESPACPVLLVRYEELRAAPEEALQGILTFIGAPIIPDRIKRAAEASKFENVRNQDAVQRFNETPDILTSGSFFRKGEALQWLRALTPRQAYQLADGCGDIMQRIGYTHPRSVMFDGRNALQPVTLRAPSTHVEGSGR